MHDPAADADERAPGDATSAVSDAASIETLLTQAVQRIVDAVHPDRIVLFGSHAYGTPAPDSDVDLLVVLDEAGSRSERYLVVASLLRPRLFPLDLLVRTPAEIEEALARGDVFIREILTRGRVLHERPA